MLPLMVPLGAVAKDSSSHRIGVQMSWSKGSLSVASILLALLAMLETKQIQEWYGKNVKDNLRSEKQPAQFENIFKINVHFTGPSPYHSTMNNQPIPLAA